MAERIAVMGIRPRPGSVRPDGHHLRWMFPPRLGFPPKGFLVYRRPSSGFKPEGCLELTDVSTTLPSGGQVDAQLYSPGTSPSTRCQDAVLTSCRTGARLRFRPWYRGR